jgi:hypothetical protein
VDKRTPGLSPFVNSTPADSSARRKAASFANVTGISPSATSARRIVATPTFEAFARSRALHLSRARAARIWALEIFRAILISFTLCDVVYITHKAKRSVGMNIPIKRLADSAHRRHFIVGSDALIIIGQDEKALIRPWQEKRGEAGPENPSASRDAHALGGQRPILGMVRKITNFSCATLVCEGASLLHHRSREGNRFQLPPRRGESFQPRSPKLPDVLFRNRRQLRGPSMRSRRARSGSCPAKRGRLGIVQASFQQFLLTTFPARPINIFC